MTKGSIGEGGSILNVKLLLLVAFFLLMPFGGQAIMASLTSGTQQEMVEVSRSSGSVWLVTVFDEETGELLAASAIYTETDSFGPTNEPVRLTATIDDSKQNGLDFDGAVLTANDSKIVQTATVDLTTRQALAWP